MRIRRTFANSKNTCGELENVRELKMLTYSKNVHEFEYIPGEFKICSWIRKISVNGNMFLKMFMDSKNICQFKISVQQIKKVYKFKKCWWIQEMFADLKNVYEFKVCMCEFKNFSCIQIIIHEFKYSSPIRVFFMNSKDVHKLNFFLIQKMLTNSKMFANWKNKKNKK